MKVTKKDTFEFQKVGIEGWVYLSKDAFPQAGVALITVAKGHETVIKSTNNAWIYFILEGEGSFIIDSEETTCQKEDLILVPKGKQFYYQGKMKMLLITVPAWEEKYEVTVGKAPKE